MPDDPTPQPTPEQAPDLTARQDARVRRLLAEARHDEPVPVDVAGRLDAVLADLGRERATATTTPDHATAPVVDLAARRRRRAATILAAAAAVVVVGVAVGQLFRGGNGAGSSASSTAGGATGDQASPLQAAPSVDPRQERAYAAARVPTVPPATFRRDAVRAGLGAGAADGPTLSQRHAGVPAPLATRAVRVCAPVHAGPGHRVPVRYAGRPAVLVVRPAAGDTRVIDLYACGGDTVVRSVTLPGR